MALWTPYADEALDLTKEIKKEAPTDFNHYHYPQDYHPYPAYNGQVSPISGISVSSYDYHQSGFRPVPLSPPVSPYNESGFSSPSDHLHNYISPTEDRRSFIEIPYDHRIQVQNAAVSMPIPVGPATSVSDQRTPFSDNAIRDDYRAVLNERSLRKRSFDSIEVDSLSDDPDFQEFERDALRAMAEKNGGVLLGNNPKMRRAVRSNNDSSDDSYRKQRERNNYAAKQSRDRRKLREIHLALKVSYLRREVAGLKALLAGKVCSRCHQSCRC